MIKWIPQGRGIVFNRENNNKRVLKDKAQGSYTHVFTSFEIAFSKKFKNYILDQTSFTDRLCLLTVDEIYLVMKWDKKFWLMYAEIEKVQKRIPCHVFLLGISAKLTKIVQSWVFEKAGFFSNYHLMQTSLDRSEIMQIYWFIEYPKSSCLNLQFILLPIAKTARDIQKTIIFVNSVPEIQDVIRVIQS